MNKPFMQIIKKLSCVFLLIIIATALSACGKSKISMDEVGNRLKDIGHDFVTGDSTVTVNENKRAAYNSAVEYIKDMLINPSTAKFSKCDEDNIAEDFNSETYYTLTVSVEAENDQGHTGTTRFYVEVSGYPDFNVTKITEVK